MYLSQGTSTIEQGDDCNQDSSEADHHETDDVHTERIHTELITQSCTINILELPVNQTVLKLHYIISER